MSDSLVPPTWPLMVFYGMSIVSLPLYFLVFACILRLRCVSTTYNTTFYSILQQHCIADLLAMIVFFVAVDAREYSFLKQYYFQYQQYYVAAGNPSYNNIYYFLYIRCTGIIFLSLQRYLIITASTSYITHKVQNASNFQIITVYWTVPTLISIVVLKDYNISYANLETMAMMADQEIIKRNTLMALIVVSLTCVTCSLLYGSLFYYIRKHTVGLSRSLRREVHLAFQVFVLLLAFFAILVYYGFQNYFSQTQNMWYFENFVYFQTGPIFYMRALYPMANGLLSYINPFCILFLNKDLAFQVARSITCNKLKVSEVHISVVGSNSTKHNDGHRRGVHFGPTKTDESTIVNHNHLLL
ncbi:CRE-SRV-32 protein [Caenorhabditis remanei]|uniref:CRE-SRV-32 protein n=1 Tax=Caenorhabditis remanei TaxID=31234 RepID=E3MSA2_CAERE|nr:CRE-SRV-32 protein [Caenorhabditis remanei]